MGIEGSSFGYRLGRWAGRLRRVFPFLRATRIGEAGLLVFLMAVIWTLWGTFLVYPLKILTVFFHELSHALAAWVTGGRVLEIRLTADQGGLCLTQGGSTVLILAAGYLGSLFWGGLLLVCSGWPRLQKTFAALLGLAILLVAFLHVRPLLSFGFVFTLLTGGAIAFAAVNFSPFANGLLLRVAGLTSCFYALLDIGRTAASGPPLHSDAALLAEATGVPAWVWGLAWLGVAVPSVYVFLRVATRRPGSPIFGRRRNRAAAKN